MSDETPDTTGLREDIRYRRLVGYLRHTMPAGEAVADLDSLLDDVLAATALDAVREQAKAEALRELADDIDSTGYGWTSVIDAERFKARLRERAARHTPGDGA